MFDISTTVPSAPMLRTWLAGLSEPVGSAADVEIIEQIELLERLKGACAARQAWLAVAFDESQRATQRALGLPADQVGRGIGEQIALARRESPAHGGRHLGLAKALVHEMPHTMTALGAGLIGEWTATVAVRETACLSADDRRQVDAELAHRLPTASPAQVRRDAWAAACRLDPHAAVNRHSKAVSERRVSVRPAPDAMTHLSALLPVKDGVAVYAALNAAASTAKASGDRRSRGQLMADELVARATATALGTGPTAGATVEVHLVMTDTALFQEGVEPALLTTDLSASNAAADLVPAPVARDLVRQATTAWLRRLYASPTSGQLVAMESSRRLFGGNLRRMLVLRDRTCRTPWCDAPIRHGDHVAPAANGGRTSFSNGQGLCERCNQTKSLPGWRSVVLATGGAGPAGSHTIRTTTPTGRTYDSTAPPLPGMAARG